MFWNERTKLVEENVMKLQCISRYLLMIYFSDICCHLMRAKMSMYNTQQQQQQKLIGPPF